MFNKNIYLKIHAISLFFLLLSIILIYFKNFKQISFLNSISSNKILVFQQTIHAYFFQIKEQIESLSNATTYKLKLLKCKAQLNQLQISTQTKNLQLNNKSNLQILAINWPEYGYITLNNPQHYKSGILVDNNKILIGKIIRSSNGFLIVKTIFTPNFQIPVYLKKSKAFGILKNQNGKLIITNISITHKIYSNDVIYVLIENYPFNIIVGKVNNIINFHNNVSEPFRNITIKSFYKNIFDLQNINSLKIIHESIK